jgi:hypothetical protein
VLAMLGVFSIFGSGRVSLEAWMAKRNAETQGEPDAVSKRHDQQEDDEREHAHAQ